MEPINIEQPEYMRCARYCEEVASAEWGRNEESLCH